MRERVMKIISKRALKGDEMAPAKALQQEGLWHVVGTERAHAKGTEQARGAWETGHQRGIKEPDRITPLGCGRDFGSSLSEMRC